MYVWGWALTELSLGIGHSSVVECWTCNRKVLGLSPGSPGVMGEFAVVSFLC